MDERELNVRWQLQLDQGKDAAAEGCDPKTDVRHRQFSGAHEVIQEGGHGADVLMNPFGGHAAVVDVGVFWPASISHGHETSFFIHTVHEPSPDYTSLFAQKTSGSYLDPAHTPNGLKNRSGNQASRTESDAYDLTRRH